MTADARLAAFAPARSIQMLLLTVSVFAANYARLAIGPLQESMRVALALSDNQMALLQGPALAFPVVVCAVPLGFLIDRYSRARLLVVLALCELLGSALTAYASSFTMLFAARALVGLAAVATFTTGMSLVADLFEPHRRGRATMIIAVSQIGGPSAAFALGGTLLTMSGAGAEGWRWAMYWLAAPLILVTLLAMALREPARTGAVIRNPTVREAWRELWRYRAVIAPLLIGMVLMETTIGVTQVWSAPMLARSFSLSPDRVGAIMAAALMISGVLGPIAGGSLADYCQRTAGPARTMILISALALLAVPTTLFAFVPSATASSALLTSFMTLVSATCVMGMTLFTVAIPNELRGLCISLMTATCTLFAAGLAPVIVSLLSGALGGPEMIGKALALVCVASCALGAAAFGFGRRFLPGSKT